MRKSILLAVLAVTAVAALVCAPLVGIQSLSWADVLDPGRGGWGTTILWKIRVPRVLTGFFAGSCLALGGLVFQALFRNPLATPFTLGVSSGASLGAVLYIRAGLVGAALGLPGTAWAAFLGALASMALVYGLVRATGAFGATRLLLAGVALSFFFSSLIMFVHYTADFQDVFRLMRWLMGSLAVSGYAGAQGLLAAALAGLVLVWFLGRELNLFAAGEDLARSRGVEVDRVRIVLLVAASLLEGAVVAVCGPIGFVGIMTPHACRLLLGYDHRLLAPACFLLGGAFLVACDTLARVVANPAELPVGVVTALLGGPFFLWLLLSRSTEELPI